MSARGLAILLLAGCASSSPAGGDAGVAPDSTASDAPLDGAPPPCTFDQPLPPPSSVLWAAPLSATGDQTLGGHGHDDGRGAVGFCAGARVPGQPYYRLVAAGFETDEDKDASGSAEAVPPDFWREPATFDGYGESGGRVAVYIDIVDEDGRVLDATSAPELRVVREILDGPTELLPLTTKPANEFQTNFPMIGGGVRYAFAVDGASDRVVNLRLPNNHHVCYQLVFRRE